MLKIRGFIAAFMQYRSLLRELVLRDIRVKYRRSYLGLLWTLLNPLLMMVILTIVFSTLFTTNIENFPVYLLCGQVIFNYFNEATNTSMTSVIGNAGLIKKVYVPKYLYCLSKVLSAAITLFSSLIALFLVMLFTRSTFYLTTFLIFIPICYILLFSLGISLILSTVAVFFRDILHLYSVVLMGWMYLTPLFYPKEILPDFLQTFLPFNPLASIIQMLRELILYGSVPTVEQHIQCIIPCFLALIIGLYIFYKNQDKFILYI
jgi:ABC-type polysaccharide/polyol phosphate export systems, permease component